MNYKTEKVRPRASHSLWALSTTPSSETQRYYMSESLMTLSYTRPLQNLLSGLLRVNENKSLNCTLPLSTRISFLLETQWWISETLTIKTQCIDWTPEISISYLYTYSKCLVNIFYNSSRSYLLWPQVLLCVCVWKSTSFSTQLPYFNCIPA